MLCPAVILPPLVFLFVLRYRHRIDAGQPAMQIDVGAALRAERPEYGIGGLAADRAQFAVFIVGHDGNMGRAAGAARVRC
jgi:hypothetical protein